MGNTAPGHSEFRSTLQGWIDDVAVFDQALTEDQIMNVINGDFTEWGGGGGDPQLQAGDADMNFEFNQLDLAQVQIAAKYLTGAAATWLRPRSAASSGIFPSETRFPRDCPRTRWSPI